MQKVIYPGTFDPITNGHIDIIERACKLFDKVVVGIAQNTQKKPTLSLQRRVELTKKALTKYEQVEVVEVTGLLTAFAKKIGANIIVRGLRAVSDFEYELQLTDMNRALEPTIETIFLTPSSKYSHISSSFIREIDMLGGDISPFVPEPVLEEFKKQS